jgi:plasmid stability protein
MADRTMTLTVADDVFERLWARAERHQRRIEEEATLALASTVRADEVPADEVPADVEAAIAALARLDTAGLWRVSRSQPAVEDGILYDALLDAGRRGALGPDEERLLSEIIARHDRVMVLRAAAIARLRERGEGVGAAVARA